MGSYKLPVRGPKPHPIAFGMRIQDEGYYEQVAADHANERPYTLRLLSCYLLDNAKWSGYESN